MNEIMTYTIVAGSRLCHNRCPICISRMTPNSGLGFDLPYVDWDIFKESLDIAKSHNVENALITGKGEPSIFPSDIFAFLWKMSDYQFNRKELQTDGFSILYDIYNKDTRSAYSLDSALKQWKRYGLDLIAISIYHYDTEKHFEVLNPVSSIKSKYGGYTLDDLIQLYQKYFKVRLSCILVKKYIDSVTELSNLIDYCKRMKVFQLTIRNTGVPSNMSDNAVSRYCLENQLDIDTMNKIENYLETNGKFITEFSFGAKVYEVKGQNVCLTTCLTEDKDRHLIFIPPDILTTSWVNVQGSRIL